MRARVLISLFAASALLLSGCGSDSGESSEAGGSSSSSGSSSSNSDSQGGGSSSADLSLVNPGTLTMCSDIPYKPFEFAKDGEYTGFDVDLMGQIAKNLGLELKVKDTGFAALKSGVTLASGSCDIAASAMTITKQRAKNLDFSDPYYNSLQTLLVPKGSDIKSIDDLSGTKVGIQQGTTGAKYAKEHVPEGTKLITYPSDAELYQAIKSGTIDAILQDLPVNVAHVHSGGFEIVQKFDTNEHYGFAVKEKGKQALLKAVNKQLAKMKKNGEYDKLFDKYFSAK